ncbi:probable inactive leucine-rich repeat receptor-like protein kinase [Tanacetum coccineum]
MISETSKLGTQVAPSCRVFSKEELAEATDNFSGFLGEGSIGKIFNPKLKSSVDLLAKLRHPHLVGLLGYCINDMGLEDSTSSRVFLVHEYISNGNFRTHLPGVIPASSSNRLRTTNILLDEHRIAKLSDYGMSIITEDLEQLEAKGDGCGSGAVEVVVVSGIGGWRWWVRVVVRAVVRVAGGGGESGGCPTTPIFEVGPLGETNFNLDWSVGRGLNAKNLRLKIAPSPAHTFNQSFGGKKVLEKTLEEGTRYVAIEFVIKLAEASWLRAFGMMRRFPQFFSRLAIALGGKTIVPVASEHLSAYLAAP